MGLGITNGEGKLIIMKKGNQKGVLGEIIEKLVEESELGDTNE